MSYGIICSTTHLFLLWHYHHYTLFKLASSVNLLWCQLCTFYCPLRKKSCPLLPEVTNVHIQQIIHQKYLNLCLPSCCYGQVIFEQGKTKTRNSTVLRRSFRPSSTLQFPIFLVSINVSEQSFPYKFLVTYFGCDG